MVEDVPISKYLRQYSSEHFLHMKTMAQMSTSWSCELE